MVAYDAGVDNIISYDNVNPEVVEDLVHGAIFTRGVEDLNNTAIFIGGADISAGEEVLKAVKDTFFANFSVSVMLDSNGSNTTTVAAILKLLENIEAEGKQATVLAAGAVGMRAAMLLAKEGCEVTLTDRILERGEKKVAWLKDEYGVDVEIAKTVSDEEFLSAIEGQDIVLSAGPTKKEFLSEEMWKDNPDIKVIADVNAVKPYGVEGIDPHDDGVKKHGKIVYGALAIGGLKMKIHHEAVAELFTTNDLVIDAQRLYQLAQKI